MVAGEESDLYASHFLLAFNIVVDSVLIVCYHKNVFYIDFYSIENKQKD